jgi:ribonuclease HI
MGQHAGVVDSNSRNAVALPFDRVELSQGREGQTLAGEAPSPRPSHPMTGSSEVRSAVEPLDAQELAVRREVVLANRRARKAAKPAYVNTDASWRGGVAGLAYEGALGKRVELVRCNDNHEAEYLALLMAMEDAERVLSGRVAFRLDSQTVVNLQLGTYRQFEDLCGRVKLLLARHPEWTLVLVEGQRNRIADLLSRRALKRAGGGPARGASSRSGNDRARSRSCREKNGRKRA